MIQRIQSLYLLISLALSSFLFFSPLVGLVNPDGQSWNLFVTGLKDAAKSQIVMKTLPMTVLFVLIVILALLAILTFRRRALQLRITVLNMMLSFLSYGIILLYIIQAKNTFPGEIRYLFGLILPLIIGISNYLAFRGIRKDILLLRSLERLR
jgi:hypothetical protein